VETFSLTSRVATQAAGTSRSVSHLSKLVDDFIGKIEAALLDGYAVPNRMAGLVPMLGCPETLDIIAICAEIVLLIDVEGFDQRPWDGLDLVIEHQHVDFPLCVLGLTCSG